MLNIAIIIGSTRPNRKGAAVGEWVYEHVREREDARYELVDLADFNLPLLDEPVPPLMHKYSKPHTKRWSAKIAEIDAFVFVTAEYNHAIPGALKNAIDFLYQEWNNKAAAFVSYGSMMGARAVEQLRLVMAELQIADVREQVGLSLDRDFDDEGAVKSSPALEKQLGRMLDQLVPWARALQSVRREREEATGRVAAGKR